MSVEAKRKQVFLSLADKLEILKSIEQGEPRRNLAKKYNVGISTISEICRRRALLLEYKTIIKDDEALHTRRRMRRPINDKVEKAVSMWFFHMRDLGKTASGNEICDKALLFNKMFNGDDNFKASNGWLQSFKARNGIQKREIKNENLSTSNKDSNQLFMELNSFVKYSKHSNEPPSFQPQENLSMSESSSKAPNLNSGSHISSPKTLTDQDIFEAVEKESELLNTKVVAALPESRIKDKTTSSRVNPKRKDMVTRKNKESMQFPINRSNFENALNPSLQDSTHQVFHSPSFSNEKIISFPFKYEIDKSFETVINWYTSQHDYCPTQLQKLQQLKNIAVKKPE